MEHDKFESIINSAVEREIEAAEMYTMLSERVSKPETSSLFRELADDERSHRAKLESVLRKEKVEIKLKEVPDLKISDYLVDQEYSDGMNYQEALTMSMKKEEKARDLYNYLSEVNLDPEVQNLFKFLAQQEATHKYRLEKEYDDVVLSEN